MSTKRTIEIVDRHHNEMTVISDGTDIEVHYNGGFALQLDEIDRDRLREFLAADG